MEFKFLDYQTFYNTKNKFPHSAVCFGAIKPKNLQDSYYLYINKNETYGFKSNVRHHCLLTLHEIKKLLRNIQTYVTFHYTIREVTHNEEKWYKIHFMFKNTNYYQVLFVLTTIRYSYEFPFNVICKDAFRLQSNSSFRQLNLINTCNLIFKYTFSQTERSVHSLCDDRVSFTVKSEIRTKLKKTERLHNIFNTFKSGKVTCPYADKLYDWDFWHIVDNFEERKQYYLTHIKDF